MNILENGGKLIRLQEDTLEKIEGKNVICFEKSASYMEELAQKYPAVYERVCGIIETNPRYQIPLEIDGRVFDVYDVSELQNYDWNDNVLLITSDYYAEAYEKIAQYVNTAGQAVYCFLNHETEIELFYRHKYENEPLRDIIVFRSGPHASSYVKGLDFADNARALFEYMLATGLNKKYELAWIVKKPEEFTKPGGRYYKYYRDYENLTFVAFDDSVTEDTVRRDEYYRVLCLSKWLFMTDAYGFCRNARKDQTRIQLWHGCGFKTRTNFVPCEKRYEYMVVIGELYKQLHADAFGLRNDQILITGYPKSDYLYHPVSENKAQKLGILPDVEDQKVIFWLPTFRIAKGGLSELNEYTLSTETGLPLLNRIENLKQLNAQLIAANVKLVLKLHPFQEKEVVVDVKKKAKLSHIIVLENERLIEEDVQIGQILAYADALISDYSSVAIEYLLLDRPLAFTLDDVAEYENSRGFHFDNIRDWLPGKELYTVEDFWNYIDEVGRGMDSSADKRRGIADKMHLHKDDQSSRRVAEALGINF